MPSLLYSVEFHAPIAENYFRYVAFRRFLIGLFVVVFFLIYLPYYLPYLLFDIVLFSLHYEGV